ncbi:hypothetical protein BB561_002247 [Smittium simulii]|uniref:Cation-transporting P-type ATPase N-terminal domain-containing protein n=1 Tax=Smittium simulii TaxID=133385 RepID=A0A2T9YR14_9FUNG|nr:hypothetical protein BB561_002247 [Smittium simulii]
MKNKVPLSTNNSSSVSMHNKHDLHNPNLEKQINSNTNPNPVGEQNSNGCSVEIKEASISKNSSYGLSHSQAQEKLQKDGKNILTPPKSKTAIQAFFECLVSLFNIMLIVAGILQYVLLAIDFQNNKPSIYIGIILIAVAFINALIEFIQIRSSSNLLKSFMNMVPSKCNVIRESIQSEISASDLVVGDLVFVKLGDKIPADMYIIKSSELQVDNSSLTGESEPQERGPENKFTNALEATNLVFNGTNCVSGKGYGIVIRTGDHTVLGQIAGLTSNAKIRLSPLSIEIKKFVKLISAVAIISAIIFFIVGQLVNRNIAFSLNFAIGIFVAWIPEGLPATVTMLLTFAAKRLHKRKVLVKELKGVDTLGAITILATDKTGTLTKNQMTVSYIWTNGKLYSPTTTSDNEAEPLQNIEDIGISNIIQSGTLCSSIKFDRTDIPFKDRKIIGDATETGLTRFVAQKNEDYDNSIIEFPKVFEIPFNSNNKWMLSIHKIKHSDGVYKLLIKGAPERILRICNTIIFNSKKCDLDEGKKTQYQKSYEHMASKGHRVIAFAELDLPANKYPDGYVFNKKEENYPQNGYSFVGLVSLEDPPKHGVREAIGRLRTAGIQVIMVTGDHPLTAEAIGRKINLVLGETKEEVSKRTKRNIDSIAEDEYDAVVIHGEEIEHLSDDDWDRIFQKPEIIFARTSPKNKLEIVTRAQSLGHVVGVTGDGVNDSPALKQSDLGIAMNISGSDVSKDAASMILLDDNFASSINGIEEGRLVFENLKKSIRYTVSHTIPEVIPQLLYILAPFPVILGALQIISIDLGCELFNSLSYAWEPSESPENLMKLIPRNPVTLRSIKQLRERNQRHAFEINPETNEKYHKSKLNKVKSFILAPFTKLFWTDLMEKKYGEVLIDKDLLSYSYIEVGIIMTVGCLLSWALVLNSHGISLSLAQSMTKNGYFKNNSPTYNQNGKIFTKEQQIQYASEASTIYYLGIFFIQTFNMFACKTRFKLPFGKHMFKNTKTFLMMLCGAIVVIAISYIPPLNSVFGTSYRLNPIWWLVPIGFGFLVLFYSAGRILFLRKFRPVQVNPDITGLQMYPTVWSTRGSKV